ncbi:MAG: tetratricopeptide repeat protein [Oscillospiraceae bacterium]|nr:tetratricopeptide repeat protein [Oscillospiraceae bacterium]
MEHTENRTVQTEAAAPAGVLAQQVEQAARPGRYRLWMRVGALLCALLLLGTTILSVASTAKITGDAADSVRASLAYQYLTQGLEYLQMDRPQQALEYLQAVTDLWPSTPEAYTAKAAVYIATAENDKAIENLEQAVALYGELAPVDVLLQLASLYVLEGDTATAMPLLDRAVETDPAEPNGWLLKGQLLYEQGSYAEAVDCFDRFLAIEPDNATALAVRAACRSGSGDEAGAMEDLVRAAELAEDDPTIRTALAEVYLNLGDFEGAIGAYRLAVEADPDDPELRRALASCLLYTGNTAEAAELFEEVYAGMTAGEQAAEDGLVVQFSLAVALLQNGDPAAAQPHFEALLEAGYEVTTVKTQLAECHAALGDTEPAFALWEELLAGDELADADRSYITLKAAATALAEGDSKGCIDYATRCLEGPLPDQSARLYRASAYLDTGRYWEAVEDMDALLAIAPDNAQYHYYRAVAWLNLDELGQAREDLEFCAAAQDQPDVAAAAQEILAQMDALQAG